MNKKIIRLTEQDLHRIVKESVSRVINEIGDTPKGQRALGALGQRHALRNPNYDARDTKSKEAKIYDYAKKARGGDTYDYKGTPQNPKYYDYANGAIDYLNSHTDELAAAHRRARIGESRITEQDLHRIVKESVNRILKENNRRNKMLMREFDDDDWDEDDYCEYDDPLNGCPYNYDEIMNDPELQREYPEAYDYFLSRDHQGEYNGWNEF